MLQARAGLVERRGRECQPTGAAAPRRPLQRWDYWRMTVWLRGIELKIVPPCLSYLELLGLERADTRNFWKYPLQCCKSGFAGSILLLSILLYLNPDSYRNVGAESESGKNLTDPDSDKKIHKKFHENLNKCFTMFK